MIANKVAFRKVAIALVVILSIKNAGAQLTVDNTFTPTQLIQNVLLGSGVTATNITYNGAAVALGSFNGTASNIGLPGGIILACGGIVNAIGPNSATGASDNLQLPGDSDLDLIMSPTLSFDATILEFDFVATSNILQFRYVFGSEEYMEYVSTTPGGINDGFGFFISGPGIAGPYSNSAENIALIPGTTLPVTMFNLNLNSNSAYYFDNGDGSGSGTAPDGLTIQYDGFTLPLTAMATVQCGQTYHIKMAIGDGSDRILDSGVFIEEGSFSFGQAISIIPDISPIGANDSTLYEGCQSTCLYFVRDSNLSNPETINITIAGTAINGTDYNIGSAGSVLPSQVSFQVGQSIAQYCIDAVPDSQAEGQETIVLTSIQTVNCVQSTKTITIYVNERPLPTASITGTNAICIGQSTTLTASGGTLYSWLNTSDTTSTITVNPTQTSTYIVEVKDSDGCKDTAQAVVAISPAPIADFNSGDVCLNQTMYFTDLSSVNGGTVTAWSYNFGDGSPIVFTQNPTHTYSNEGTFAITFIGTSNLGCLDTITKNVVVHALPQAQFSVVAGCVGSFVSFTDLSTLQGSDNLLFWDWDYGDGTAGSSNNQNPLHQYNTAGTYSVELLVSSNFGCQDSIINTVIIAPPIVLSFTASDSTGCSPLCTNFNNLYVNQPGVQASYLWDFGDLSPLDTTKNPMHCYTNASLVMPQIFTVSLTVIPSAGCITTYTKNNFITVNPSPVADFSLDPNTTSILTPEIAYQNLSLGETTWNWNLGDQTTDTVKSPPPHTYADTGSYVVTLIVSNQFNCSDTATKTAIIEPDWSFYIPNSFTPNGNGRNDKFQGYGYGILEYEMIIFDRWGNELYNTKNYNEPWDGKVKNRKEIVQTEVYVYVFNIKDVIGLKHIYRGIVTLIR